MGVGLKPLEFTECITDSPSFREKLHAHEKELEGTSLQMKRLIKELKDLLNAAQNLSKAQRALSSTLKNFKFECIGESLTEDECIISQSFAEFGKLIDTIEEERGRMLTRTHDQIIVPLEDFRKSKIGGVKEGKKKFEKQTAKFCQSQERYLSHSTRKHDAFLQEADASLEMEQRHFYHASLQYVFLLQEVQERKKFEFVEILLTLMLGWLTFYHQGYETAEESRPYLNDLQFRIQRTRENFDSTKDKTESLMKKTFEMRQMKLVEGGVNKPYTKEGYLFLMEKKAFGTTWTKHYCTYKKEAKEFCIRPYNQMIGKFNPCEVLMLDSCIRRTSDSIDKRFCFDLTFTSSDRTPIVYTFQALSEEDRRQWMDIMDGKEPTYSIPVTTKHSKTEEPSVELNDAGFAFVARCIELLEPRLDEQGLYRVGGVTSKITKFLAMGLDRKKLEKMDESGEWDTKTVTSALKTYFRSLPEPLMTFQLHSEFIVSAKCDSGDQRLKLITNLVHRLPRANYNMLKIFMEHLHRITLNAEKNLMTASNLGVCLGPSLLRPEFETVAAIIDIKFYNIVVEILIDKYEQIFNIEEDNFDIVQQPSTAPTANRRKMAPSQPPVKAFYEGAKSLSSSTHNSPVVNAIPQVSFPSVQNLRGGRVSSAVAALSEGNLNVSPSHISPSHTSTQAHSPSIKPHLMNSSAYPPESLTSSSNESVSSLPSRDFSNHTYGAPQKAMMASAREVSHYGRVYQHGRVRTLYACVGEHDGELTFDPNQIITNVRASLEPGWLEGTLNGKTGLVPENYVEPLP